MLRHPPRYPICAIVPLQQVHYTLPQANDQALPWTAQLRRAEQHARSGHG